MYPYTLITTTFMADREPARVASAHPRDVVIVDAGGVDNPAAVRGFVDILISKYHKLTFLQHGII
jgi:hypothetical protein